MMSRLAERLRTGWKQTPHAYPLCALSLFPLLFFVKARVQGGMLFGSDTLLIFAPLRALGFEHLRRGNLLEWNPYIVAGMPYLGEIQTTLLYPLSFLFLFLPLPLAITLTPLLHLWLSGVFMYLFVRQLQGSRMGAVIAGLTYQLSGFQLAHLYAGHHTITTTYTWLPLLFLLAQRAVEERSYLWTVGVGVALCLQILAGYPGITYYTCVGLALWWIALSLRQALAKARAENSEGEAEVGRGMSIGMMFRHLLGSWTLGGYAVMVALALAAFQILPTLETAAQSMREGGTPYRFASSFSLPPENLLCLLFPDLWGDSVRIPYWGRWYGWEVMGYVGVLPLLLAVAAVTVRPSFLTRFWGALALLALLLSLGRYLFFYPWVYRLLPGLAFFRGPARALVLWTLAVSVLAGIGWDRVAYSDENERRRLRLLTGCLSVLSAVGVLGLILSAGQSGVSRSWVSLTGYLLSLGTAEERYANVPYPHPAFLQASFSISQQSLFWGVLLLTFAAAWMRQRLDQPTRRGWMLAGLVIVGMDLLAYGNKYVQGVPFRRAQLDPEVARFLQQRRRAEGPFRVVNLTREYSDNVGAMHGIEMVGGFDPFIPQRFVEFANVSEGRPMDVALVVVKLSRHSPLLDLLNARYFMTNRDAPLKDNALVEVFQNRHVRLYENRRALPRAWVVHNVQTIPDRVALLTALAQKQFDPRRTLLVEQPLIKKFPPANEPMCQRPDAERCQIMHHSPERVVIQARLATDGYVVLADAFFPGWEARVDGKAVAILRANYLFRAVPVPSGEHTITFVYRSSGLRRGAWVSVGAWGCMVISVLLFVRRSRQNPPPVMTGAVLPALPSALSAP
ncbi:MAG: YfhO family protein [Abditibacteriales bacterium]|nr:YfhO family protein [Abditibacteriales bacterium]